MRLTVATLGFATGVITAVGMALIPATFISRAVQNPVMSLDMVTTGNTYDGTATQTMSVGTIDKCVSDPSTVFPHTRTAQLIIQNVEDLVGAQARINHEDTQVEVTNLIWSPFTDPNTLAPVGFLNLPVDPLALDHRSTTAASDFTQPNTSLASASYLGDQQFGISPDTPPKAASDGNTSYSAPSGGILATVVMSVKAGANGNTSNFLNLDDGVPNLPQSSVDILTGAGIFKVNLDNAHMGDGYVGSGTGVNCVVPACDPDCPGGAPPTTPPPTPTATPTPCLACTPTPTSTPPPKGSFPSVRLDMVTTGNTYDGTTTQTMTVGTIDNCLTEMPGNNAAHNVQAHLILQNVEDLAGAQVRINHADARLEVTNILWTPFSDPNTLAPVGFLNLPIDPVNLDHRALTGASDFSQPNTSLAAQSYLGDQNFAISPDTPPKSPTPDDNSYSAPTGGILATVVINVKAGQLGQPSLAIDLDHDPPPGSSVDILTGAGIFKMNLQGFQLGDGFIGNGVACVAGPQDEVETDKPVASLRQGLVSFTENLPVQL